jgi:hypothetical protein
MSGTYPAQSCTAPTGCSCSSPWGTTVADGTSVTAYSVASTGCGATPCSSYAQSRTCNNGTLSGSAANQACTNATGCSCNLPWGGTLADGQSVTAYSTNAPGCGSSCTAVSQVRTCNNGVLSGAATFSSQGCGEPMGCPCTLPWGGTITHGQMVQAYSSASALCGTCSANGNRETRLCSNGTLTGSFTNQNCADISLNHANGTSCGRTCDCASGYCGVYYVDGDGDGVGSTATAAVCGPSLTSAPAGYSTLSTDCCDTDARVHPGAGFVRDMAGSACNTASHDFDCNGTTVLEYGSGFGGCTYASVCSGDYGYSCNSGGFSPGWSYRTGNNAFTGGGTAAIPACGAWGEIVLSCGTLTSGACGNGVYCNFGVYSQQQGCK